MESIFNLFGIFSPLLSALLNWLGALPGAAAQGMVWGIMAIGVYITYKILDIADLTVDGSICTGGAVCAVLVTNGVDIWLAILASVLVGMIAGAVTGCLHTFMGIPAILAGILTQLMLWSINLKIMGKANVALPVRNYDLLIAQIKTVQSILVLLAFVVVLIIVLYCFFGTEIGNALRATGNNLNMSRAQGINTDITKILGLVISNGIVALSGALLAQYQGFSDISMGRGAIVIGLAAVIIGEAVISKISQNFAVRLLGVVIGGIIYYFVYQTVIFLGLDADLLKMLSAIVVAVFLAVPYWKKKYFTKPKGEAAKITDKELFLEFYPKIKKQRVVISIILSIVTFGIYNVIWQYRLVKSTKALQIDKSNCVLEMLCYYFLPFYDMYWWYTRGNAVKKIYSTMKLNVSSHGFAFLTLNIIGYSIVNQALMQSDFNMLTESDFVKQPEDVNNQGGHK